MKKHSLMITAAALAAAMVLGTGCAKKPAVETSETVTSQASAEETTKAPETTAKAPETTEQAAEAKEVYHMLQGTVTKVTADNLCFSETVMSAKYDLYARINLLREKNLLIVFILS